MRSALLAACLLLPLAALAPRCTHAERASGGQSIHRCIGEQGELAFSDVPCGADPLAVLTVGSARGEDQQPGASYASYASYGSQSPAARAHVPAGTCPVSRRQLRDRIAAAVMVGNANALAGLMRWRGVQSNTAESRLRRLRDLVAHPLLAIETDAFAIDVHDDGLVEAAPADRLRVRTGGLGSGQREHSFGVSERGRCYWLVW